MKKFAWTILLVCACAGLGLAQTKVDKIRHVGVDQHLKQIEHDWMQAMKAGNTARLNEIVAEDWVGVYADGSKSTRQKYVEDVKAGRDKVESYEIGPMDVKVLGNVAVVQGSDTEKSSSDGKDTSGTYAWTDVFVNRGGKWQAVRSQMAKVK